MNAPQDPGVYISPAQTFEEVRGLSRKVDQIDGKLDRILDETREIKGDLSDHESRIRALELGETERQKRETARIDELETRRWPLPAIGAVAALVGAAGGVAGFILR
ncbi:hypothetical protein [Streptomyces sp900129855]|jgi:chromosome segregation ATPase|uniref:DUF3618 domain-containing protein n=1 Tax=Streptomyces sp. 900129855 TaxID=3155129 RepID=A0ABV2ZJH0_9ACTN